MHGNNHPHYILGTPQQSGGFLVCSVNLTILLSMTRCYIHGEMLYPWRDGLISMTRCYIHGEMLYPWRDGLISMTRCYYYYIYG